MEKQDEVLRPYGPTRNVDEHWVPSPDLFDDNAADDDLWTTSQRPLDSIPLIDSEDVRQAFGQPSQYQHDVRRELFGSSQWLSKRTHAQRIDMDNQMEGQLWTFIHRGPEPRFDAQSRIQCIYVDHGDHYHFLFKASPQNKMRAFNRIIQAAHIPSNLALISTIQPVVNWDKFASYLVRDVNFRVICKGNTLQHLRTDLATVPRKQADCSSLMRNERAAKQKHDNVKRHQRTDVIQQLVEQYDARTIHELQNSLSYQDRLDLYTEFGNLWQETAKLVCRCYTENLVRTQVSTPFRDYIITKNHNRVCTHPADTTEGERWLDLLLEVNKIQKWEILTSLEKIMDRQLLRINALVIEGPTTTGKLCSS